MSVVLLIMYPWVGLIYIGQSYDIMDAVKSTVEFVMYPWVGLIYIGQAYDIMDAAKSTVEFVDRKSYDIFDGDSIKSSKTRSIARFSRRSNVIRVIAVFRRWCKLLTSSVVDGTLACMKINGGLHRRGACGGYRDKHYTIATHILLWRDNKKKP